jgi:hypothetical protein
MKLRAGAAAIEVEMGKKKRSTFVHATLGHSQKNWRAVSFIMRKKIRGTWRKQSQARGCVL